MARRDDYNVGISFSTRELTKLEKLMFQQSPDSISLDKVTREGAVVIDVDYAVVLEIHNERNNGDKDYTTTYIVDKNGVIYKTGSESFTNNLIDIADALQDELSAGESFPAVKVFQKPSKTRSDTKFITCTVHTGPVPSTPTIPGDTADMDRSGNEPEDDDNPFV